jgi:hypothetical protein
MSFEIDASSESRELDEILRELERLMPGGDSIDWQESRRWCAEILEGVRSRCEKSQRLADLLNGAEYIVGGDEQHIIRLEQQPERLYKATHGENFRCRSYFSPHDPELTGKHFHGTGNADPFFYLKRWRLLNDLGGFKTRFEGFLPPTRAGFLPQICISQPMIVGENPSREAIRAALAKYEFREISEDAFLNFQTRLLLTDAAPRNVRIVAGVPVPFDAIAQPAPAKVLAWASR